MCRIASKCLAATAALFLLAVSSSLLGQPTPTPTPGPSAGPGPWSAAHPLWFDLNGDGSPQAGELTGSPVLVGEGCTQVVGYPAVIGSSESPCTDVYEDGGIGGSLMRSNGVTQRVSTNEAGTLFTFIEEDEQIPTRQKSGVKALAVRATGTGQLLDLNGDGIYDSLQVQGSKPSGAVPQTRMSLVPRDVTGDGRPDYITVPWTTGGAGMLGVYTDSTPQIYVPLTDTNEDGWPDTVTVQVANGGLVTNTGPPVSGAAFAAGDPIPTASTFGLFVFAAAVVALGVKLLRGTIVAS
jgi:hypothetical protein